MLIHVRSFSWSLAVLTGMATGAFWACSSSDGAPIPPPGILEPPDASPQDAGPDARVEPKKLTVVALTPANGDTNVSVQDPIQVTFSEPVKIGPSSITLETPDGTLISTRVELSANERTITVSPVTPQNVPSELTAHFGDISTLDGEPLPSKPAWSWKLPAWVRVGSDLLERFNLGDASLVTGPGRRIALAAHEHDDYEKPRWSVSTLDTLHGTWTQLGGPLPLITWDPHMLLDRNGDLVVSSDNTWDKVVQRWSGTGWDKLGEPIANVRDASDSPLAIGAQGKLLLACSEKIPGGTTTYNLIVRAFDGKGSWSPIGGPVNDSPMADPLNPHMAVDPTGVPYVAYTDPSVHVRKWTGSAWTPVGSNLPTTGGDLQWLRIAFDDGGRLFGIGMFWDGTTRVIRFDGSDWVLVGEALSTQRANAPSLVAGHDGHVFAAVYDDWSNQGFRVADITQAGWKLESPIEHQVSALAVDRDNVPIVVAPRFGVLRLNR
ncbi:Ig-like domain-containing protein [Pendulispora rubella]|uniref:Ig-like domain-containing protein n=1 Tax=Pendulispora rubella TaxID=2741070 RepID=A0ABZ2KRJ1_9BACT